MILLDELGRMIRGAKKRKTDLREREYLKKSFIYQQGARESRKNLPNRREKKVVSRKIEVRMRRAPRF